MSDETVKVAVLCAMFQAMLRDRSSAKKRKHLRTFLDRVFTANDRYFSALRLILPALDRERGTYGLKEHSLAACLIEAMGISKDSEDASRLVNWRKGGARSGSNAGNFALIATDVLQRRQGLVSGGLTVKELNDALDLLASKESRGEKASVLSDLIKRTNSMEMKWILMIILKDLKLGISERSIFQEFHPDAEDLFNVTCDLKLVCEKLKDRSQRHKRQDIEVGKPVRPQLAMRVSNAATAWKKFHGKQVVLECKFDGDRIQIHKNGSNISFFSRNFLDHSEYAPGMSKIVENNISVDRCILDGEMLVWDTSTNHFAEFGTNQEIAKAAREGVESNRQLCYVAFDILYAGDSSVIHQSLEERHALLREMVRPVKGRLEVLVPNGGLNDSHLPGEPCWSIMAKTLDDVEKFYKEMVENRDEGVILKDLGSKWEPSDRSGKWLKLKPDYIHAGADLDVLIIGGYFGSGRRGGQVSQFLMALADGSKPDNHPRRFISFCRVGSGLSDEELDSLVDKLNPFFRRNEYPKKAPHFFDVTYHAKERPDVWVESPDRSVILSITSDVRTIKSEVFAAPYSLRFPRIDRVRYDKPWHECLDVQSFIDLVHSSSGTIRITQGQGNVHEEPPERVKSLKRGRHKFHVVPSHLAKTDVSGVKEETPIFTHMMFYFANIPSSSTLEDFHKLVTENGGKFSMNLNDSVTHCVAAERKGIKYQAAMRHGDVIHYSWILDCSAQKRLLHVQPKYLLFISDSSKKKLQEEMDLYSDYYYWDIDLTDLKQMFGNMISSRKSLEVTHYDAKYWPSKRWRLLHDCYMFFYQAPVPDWDEGRKVISQLGERRMKLEVAWHGGQISTNLSTATHLVLTMAAAQLSPSSEQLFWMIHDSFSPIERPLLRQLHVVDIRWLEDSLTSRTRLYEETYSVRPQTIDFDIFKVKESMAGKAREMEVGSLKDKVQRKREGSGSGTATLARPRDRTRAKITEGEVTEDTEKGLQAGNAQDEDKKKVSYKEMAARLLEEL
ncbi:DNA ligase IV [Wolffia australiana]